MKVYVIMGNDFPDSVFKTESAAEQYIAAKKADDPANTKKFAPRIHWRSYEFEVRQ